MVNLGLFLFLLLSFHCMPEMVEAVVASNSNPSGINFIRASCKATLYPVLCFQSLSHYATKIQQNELDLAQAALSVSLTKAQLTKMFISRMIKAPGIKSREYGALIDCIDNMGDTVNQLNRSIKELNRMKLVRGQGFMWHMSNVLTWVSAALTNENTCIDGFSGNLMEGNVQAAIKSRIIAVSQVTSNSLALVNRFAARHRGATAAASNIP